MNRRVKKVLLRVLRRGGVFGWSGARRWRNRRLLIVGYHGISIADEHRWDPSLYLSPAAFEERLELLRRHRCSVLPLSEGLQRLCAGTLPERAVVLTFDDGTYDFHVRAYPLLKTYGYPATVYLTTYYARCGEPVFDVSISYMLWKNRGRVIDATALTTGCRTVLDLSTRSGLARAVRSIHAFARAAALDQRGKQAFLTRLAALLGFRYDAFCASRMLQIMNAGEIADLAAAGVDFQLHTHRHRVPSDPQLFAKEIEDNRAAIAEMTGTVPVHFCYPSNVYRPEFLSWLSELNVVSATTSDPGLATRRSNTLLLPRLVDSANIPPVEFESWICGLSGRFHGSQARARVESGAETAVAGGCRPAGSEPEGDAGEIRSRTTAA